MTRQEVVMKAVAGRLSWLQAADILGITPRHVRRLHWKYRNFGVKAVVDNRGGKPRRRRVALEVVQELFRLRRLLHLDASTHAWLPELPMQDLMVMLDDADGRILHARFVEQEDTLSSLAALSDVLERHGRFSELYTDRGSHFAPTAKCRSGELRPEGQVQRVLRAVGIRHILARSPEARGRSERAFGTIQGRLPQELRLHGLRTYADANLYLDTTFVPDFNRRFTVVPAERGSAFVKVARSDLELLLSVQHERVVRPDSIVVFEKLLLQLPASTHRQRFIRCPVLVHEFLNDTLGVSYQGRLIARFNRAGDLLPLRSPTVAAA